MGGSDTCVHKEDATQRPYALAGVRISFLWPACALIGVVYASLLPFRLDLHAFTSGSGFGLDVITFAPTSVHDIVANLALYVPVSLLFSLHAMARGPGRWRCVLIPVLIASAASLGVEWLQTGIAHRVASWWDVILNLVGAVGGAALATGIARWRPRSYAVPARRPWRSLVTALGVSLFVYHLLPFDFVTSTEALHASFGRARLELLPHVLLDPGGTARKVADAATAAWFGLFAWLFAMTRLRGGTTPALAAGSATRQGVLLVVLIETLQLFTGAHVFEMADIVMRSAMVLIGAWCAGLWPRHAYRLDRSSADGLRSALIGLALAVQVALLLATVRVPSIGISWDGILRSGALPFESLWRAPMHLAVTDMIATCVTYGSLAATMTLLLAPVSRHPTGPIVCLVVPATALFLAIARAVSGQAPVDVTDAALATLAAFAAVDMLGHGGERLHQAASAAD